MKRIFVLGLAWLLTLPAAQAGGIERLRQFAQTTQSAQGQFTQKVLDKKRKLVQESTGQFLFVRPGKFRWVYEKPHAQLIVGDGQRLWVYDPDLNQVTVQKLDDAIGSSPAALLAGSNEIDRYFTLENLGHQEGLDWVQATPKSKESGFHSVRMGFGSQTLEKMELRDHFGQTTLVMFRTLERNPKTSPDKFRFIPPKGADVLGE